MLFRHPLARAVGRWSLVGSAGLVFVFVGLAFICRPDPSHAAFPGKNGAIVFERRLPGDADAEIWVASQSGKQRRLTDNGVEDTQPAVSPDGRRIAFVRWLRPIPHMPSASEPEIFVMRFDGTHLRQVTSGGPLRRDRTFASPAFAPGGERLVYTVRQSRQFDTPRSHEYRQTRWLEILDLRTGRTSTPIGPRLYWQTDPTWSPDGRWIAFGVTPRGADGYFQGLFKVHPSGKDLTRLTKDAQGVGDPDFSPDGRQLVYQGQGCEPTHPVPAIWIVGVSGNGRRALTGGCVRQAGGPAFAPSGDRLIFSSARIGEQPAQSRLVVTDLRGRKLTGAPDHRRNGVEGLASWAVAR